jgi:hypothetical protein
MHKILAAAILLAIPLPAKAQANPSQTNSLKKFFYRDIIANPNAATGTVAPVKRKTTSRSARRTVTWRRTARVRGATRVARGGPSTSRGCLTAPTQALLAQLEGRFGPVKVISTCRPGAVIAGSGRPSQHRYGKAVDFVPPPGQRAAMIAWLRQNAAGMVITYRSGHVHFDTGSWRGYACSGCGSRKVAARRAYAAGAR